ncbi:hypothetical protein SNE26_20635 [Mucilaginibacter sp. cycad4]|uniref:hypothetical protein n=1 Tax=Mucilaginibacter sp. cycad4 TaxID=3342096 RepID=UPI002AAA672E|nr:hypothetical protein [Mucilaginibacter gossypii]WPU98436.1 hypothetical protein SNE26_20635 [Mucilaginibacter gossypii]
MKTQHSYTIPCGLLLIAFCLFIRYVIGRRRFNRRGIAGLQQFSSYRKFVVTTTIERVILFVANLCGCAGIFLLAVAGFNHLKL